MYNEVLRELKLDNNLAYGILDSPDSPRGDVTKYLTCLVGKRFLSAGNFQDPDP